MGLSEVLLDIHDNVISQIFQYPLLCALIALILIIGFLRIYTKMNVGTCNIDQDMSGKTVLITGATAGIGKTAAIDLARRNARVILACRNVEKANKVVAEIESETGNQNVIVKHLDLSSFQSVRECAKSVLETEDNLHVLINNAGTIGPEARKTVDGNDTTMQSNHLGHFLLTLLLLDLIKRSAPSRIINVSSTTHTMAKLDLEDINKEFHYFTSYANSKLANILFTKALAERLKESGVTVNALHPGHVRTDLIKPPRVLLICVICRIVFSFLGKNAQEGAQTTIQLAVDPQLAKTTGKYFANCKSIPASKTAEDMELARKFFHESERIVGKSFPTS